MKKSVVAAVSAAAALVAAVPAAQAQDTGSWIVRGRVLHLNSANKSSPDIDLNVNNKTFPEVDITYFISPNLAAELILTYPQKHDASVGDTKIGTLKHLPPTLSLQYHFTGMGFRPYVGAGLNYTRFMSVDLPEGIDIDKNSFGLAFGAGADFPIGGGWLINVDVKKAYIRTDVSGAVENQDVKFKVDPVLFSVGVGKRF